MSVIQLAMYKGKGKIGNRLTRFWTRSKYSHCEIVINGFCYSSSFMDGGVRKKVIDLTDGKWDLFDIPWASERCILCFFNRSIGSGYDWAGLLGSQVFNRRCNNPNRYFCSEWAGDALGIPNPEAYSPQSLLNICLYLNERHQSPMRS